MKLRRGISALVIGAAFFALPAMASAGAATTGPTGVYAPGTHVSVAAGSAGTVIRVFGEHWPASNIIDIRLCGNNALDGSADCDLGGAKAVGSDPTGAFSTPMTIAIPPSPCPCVVRVSSDAATTAVNVPFNVIGAGEQAPITRVPVKVAAPSITVEHASLDGSDGLGAWLGGSAARVLTLTLKNTSTNPVANPPLFLFGGTSNNPDFTITAPDLPSFAPGQTRTVRVSVSVDPFTFGDWHLIGHVGNSYDQTTFKTSTSTYPWGLFVLALVLSQLILLWIRNAIRRRRFGKEEAPPTGGDLGLPAYPSAPGGGAGDAAPTGAPASDPNWVHEGMPIAADAEAGVGVDALAVPVGAGATELQVMVPQNEPVGVSHTIIPRPASMPASTAVPPEEWPADDNSGLVPVPRVEVAVNIRLAIEVDVAVKSQGVNNPEVFVAVNTEVPGPTAVRVNNNGTVYRQQPPPAAPDVVDDDVVVASSTEIPRPATSEPVTVASEPPATADAPETVIEPAATAAAPVAEPHVVEPRAAAPRVVEPKSAAPHVVEPHVVEPHVVEPHVEAPQDEEALVGAARRSLADALPSFN